MGPGSATGGEWIPYENRQTWQAAWDAQLQEVYELEQMANLEDGKGPLMVRAECDGLSSQVLEVPDVIGASRVIIIDKQWEFELKRQVARAVAAMMRAHVRMRWLGNEHSREAKLAGRCAMRLAAVAEMIGSGAE